jgi:hypothetical protein
MIWPYSGFMVKSTHLGFLFAVFMVPCSMMAYGYFTFCVQDPNGLYESMPLMIDLGHTMLNMRHFAAVPMINMKQL